MKKLHYFLTAACLLLSLIISCKEDKEPDVPTLLTIDRTSISVDANSSRQTISVFSNRDWTITKESSWLTITPTSGKADSKMDVEITISANTETTARNAFFTVISADISKQVDIYQEGKEETPFIPGIEIADAKFKQYLLENFDLNGDGEISSEEAEAVTFMDCSGMEIESLGGLEFFVNLDTLYCANNLLTSIDVSKNVRLVLFDCSFNRLQSLDVSGNIEIETLACFSNQLADLNVSGNVKLKMLDCSSNTLASLDASHLISIEKMLCMENELTALDIGENTSLLFLDCSGNQLTVLDISKSTALEELYAMDNQLDALDVGGNVALTTFNCTNNLLDALDVSGNVALTTLNCTNNLLTALDMSGSADLTTLNCANNELATLDISGNADLTTLNCANNGLTILDVRNNASLTMLDCRDNPSLTKILLAEDQVIPDLFYDPETTNLEYPAPEKNIIDIPDAKFKAYLIANFDKDKDGEISEEEALTIKEISCLRMEITSMTGIESFPNLEILNCTGNQLLSLDVTNNLKLKELVCNDNNIRFLDVKNNVLLTNLSCGICGLRSLDLSANTELVVLSCPNNNLTELNLLANVKLERLVCQQNELKVLDLRKNRALGFLSATGNPDLTAVYLDTGQQIASLYISTPPTHYVYMTYYNFPDAAFLAYLVDKFDVDGDQRISQLEAKDIVEIDCSNLGIASLEGIHQLTGLTSLTCSGNQLTSININALTELVTLVCDNNQLSRLDLSRNTKLETLDCSFNELGYFETSYNKELKTIICNDNILGGLSLSGNTKLETLLCQNNDLFRLIDLSHNLSLHTLHCQNNPRLLRLTLRAGQTIEDLQYDEKVASVWYAGEDQLGIDIPDPKFREYLVNHFDTDNDGEVSFAEALLVRSIDCQDLDIFSLAGIENFTNLTSLRCAGNHLVSIPTSSLPLLETLDCSANELSSLNVMVLPNLRSLFCRTNQLTELNVMYNPELVTLDCESNQLSTLNVRRNPRLRTVNCRYNNPGFIIYKASSQTSLSISTDGTITTTDIVGVSIQDVMFEDYLVTNFDANGDGSIDASELAAITEINCSNLNISSLTGIKSLTNLSILNCGNNNLSSLDLSGMSNLTMVFCFDNKLTSINVTGCTSLGWLYCPGNQLTTLNLAGNQALTVLDCSENPRLATVYLSLAHHTAGMVNKDEHTNLVFQ